MLPIMLEICEGCGISRRSSVDVANMDRRNTKVVLWGERKVGVVVRDRLKICS